MQETSDVVLPESPADTNWFGRYIHVFLGRNQLTLLILLLSIHLRKVLI